MTTSIETYLQQVKGRLLVDPNEQAAIISELRSHLVEELDARCRADPSRAREDLAAEVVDAFGSPEDVATAYNPPGRQWLGDPDRVGVAIDANALRPIVEFWEHLVDASRAVWADTKSFVERHGTRRARRTQTPSATDKAGTGAEATPSTGSDAERPRPSAHGRTTRGGNPGGAWPIRALRTLAVGFVAVVVAFFTLIGHVFVGVARAFGGIIRWATVGVTAVASVALVIATIGGLFFFDDIQAIVESRLEVDVLSIDQDCSPQSCNGTHGPVPFHVGPGARELHLWLHVHEGEPANGSLSLQVVDPRGNTVLARDYIGGQQHQAWESHTLPPTEGTWQVTYETTSFRGWIAIDADVRGVTT